MITAATFWLSSIVAAFGFGLLRRLVTRVYNRNSQTPEQPLITPEEQYQYDLQIQHQEAIRDWDYQFLDTTGKRVDWLLDPSLEQRQLAKDRQNAFAMTVGPGMLMNLPYYMRAGQEQSQDYMAQQNQQYNAAQNQQQQLMANQQLGQLGSGLDPQDMNTFISALRGKH